MAFTKFTKRDLNRYRKVYPYVRREPRMAFISNKEVTMEVGSITFEGENSPIFKRYMFTERFPSPPMVTATSVDSKSSGTADVNTFIKVVTRTYVEVEVSQKFIGTVHFQAIWIGS
tara:strand:+ start:2066 stop:2413 length:348 start_codon:yes stop_codon:yes gene_type:complete